MKIEQLVEELLSADKKVDETSTTAATPGYDTPNAFTGKKAGNEKRRKRSATVFGYTLTGKSDLKEIELHRIIRKVIKEIVAKRSAAKGK